MESTTLTYEEAEQVQYLLWLLSREEIGLLSDYIRKNDMNKLWRRFINAQHIQWWIEQDLDSNTEQE